MAAASSTVDAELSRAAARHRRRTAAVLAMRAARRTAAHVAATAERARAEAHEAARGLDLSATLSRMLDQQLAAALRSGAVTETTADAARAALVEARLTPDAVADAFLRELSALCAVRHDDPAMFSGREGGYGMSADAIKRHMESFLRRQWHALSNVLRTQGDASVACMHPIVAVQLA